MKIGNIYKCLGSPFRGQLFVYLGEVEDHFDNLKKSFYWQRLFSFKQGKIILSSIPCEEFELFE